MSARPFTGNPTGVVGRCCNLAIQSNRAFKGYQRPSCPHEVEERLVDPLRFRRMRGGYLHDDARRL